MSMYIDNLVSEGMLDTKSFRSQMASTVASAGTLSLLVGSELVQIITGSATGQIVQLPDATTLLIGHHFEIWNEASVNITIQDGAAAQLLLLGPGQRAFFRCRAVGSSAGTWGWATVEKTPTAEQFKITYPGTGLLVNFTAGNYRLNGTLTAVAAGAITLPISTTGTIYVDIDGVVKATASLPNDAAPLYSFVTSGSAVTSLTDVREDVENNAVWGVVGDISATTKSNAASAGTLEKAARADHVHASTLPYYKAGQVAAGTFSGSPKKATVTFGAAMPSTAYNVVITGSDARSFTIESITTSGFVINANANQALTGMVMWVAVATGESL